MEQLLSVEEATNIVYSDLEEFTGWKFLRSQRCLKKKVKDLELVINFFTSQWNKSHEYVGINADFRVIYKKLGKLPVQNVVASCDYHPRKGDDTYWYDISSKEKVITVMEILKSEIQETALQLESNIENDYKEAIKNLFENHFDDYGVKLEFVADVLGVDAISLKAHSIFDALSDDEKQDIIDYKNGKLTRQWMYNPTNLKFIVDNNLMD